MVGGLALSQLLTLYTTPLIYLYLDRLQRFVSTLAVVPPRGFSKINRSDVAQNGVSTLE